MLSYRSGPIVNRVFFKAGSRLYCLWQGEDKEGLPQRDFALADEEENRIIHTGPWDELPGVVSRLACERLAEIQAELRTLIGKKENR
jgi:hypothetical protein